MSRKLGFSVKALDQYDWPVDVKVPFMTAQGDGDYETHRFTGRFRHLSMTEVDTMFAELQGKIDALKEAEDAQLNSIRVAELSAQYQIDLYMGIWVGWGNDLSDENGAPLPCTEDARRALLGKRIVREAVIQAYQDSQAGEVLRLKNSETSPEAGPATGES